MVKRQIVKPLLPPRVGDGILEIDIESFRNRASYTGLRLLWYIQNVVCWGEVTVIVKNGEPVRIIQSVREVKLNGDDKSQVTNQGRPDSL